MSCPHPSPPAPTATCVLCCCRPRPLRPQGYICSSADVSGRGRRAVDLLEPWLEGWKRKSKDKVRRGEGEGGWVWRQKHEAGARSGLGEGGVGGHVRHDRLAVW